MIDDPCSPEGHRRHRLEMIVMIICISAGWAAAGYLLGYSFGSKHDDKKYMEIEIRHTKELARLQRAYSKDLRTFAKDDKK